MTPRSNGKRAQPSDLDLSFLKGKAILVTGGTGSFGRECVKFLLTTKASKVVVFSRDELKQSEMQRDMAEASGRLRFFMGDVRDLPRLRRAFHGIDYVIHAAALKQVPTLEYNPYEAVLTNVVGGQNVIDAAIDERVRRVVALSTDKAANPINLYGATKLCAEKLFIAGNSYTGGRATRFAVVRYGNVIGSRGSVIPLFLQKRSEGVLPITDERMTRFWITLEQGVQFVVQCLQRMHGAEVFVPKIPSMRVTDLARAVAPGAKLKTIGIRPGEKLHEVLLTEDETPRAVDMGTYFVVKPLFTPWGGENWKDGQPLKEGFHYASDSNDRWLAPDELLALCRLS